jgi:hypothetical protein
MPGAGVVHHIIFDRVIELSLRVDVRFDPECDQDRAASQYVAMGRTHAPQQIAFYYSIIDASEQREPHADAELPGGSEVCCAGDCGRWDWLILGRFSRLPEDKIRSNLVGLAWPDGLIREREMTSVLAELSLRTRSLSNKASAHFHRVLSVLIATAALCLPVEAGTKPKVHSVVMHSDLNH